MYCFGVRENQAKKMESFAFSSILGSQVVSLLQMLGALQTLSVTWPEPVATVVEMGSLMNFKLEVLNLGCVVSMPPLIDYIANAFAVVALMQWA